MATPFLRPPLHLAPSRHREVAPLSQVTAITACPASRQPPSPMRPMSTIAIVPAAAAAPGPIDDTGGNRGRGPPSEGDCETNDEIKTSLYRALEGTNRGIFGITSAKKSDIEGLVELLESQNPTPHPTDHLLATVDGCWKLVYSTILILGVKRTKLGLRDFISLGDFFQIIDVAKERAVNVIKFNITAFAMLTGQLTIEASFKIASKTRVNIKLENSNITPDQLMNLFQKNYDLLLAIFNPEGWLEITYVDDSMRIGRDDKGNIFVLEKTEQDT